MNTFVISLKDSTERRKFMSEQLSELGISFEFFDAFWGANYYNDEKYFAKEASVKYEKRVMTPGEVGCALSHQGIYKKIVEENIPYALIFEDDAIVSKDIIDVLPELEKIIKPNQLITLNKCDLTYNRNKINIGSSYYLAKPYMVKYGSMAQTTGYIITKEAAEKILSINFPVYIPSDSWGRYRKIIDFRGVIPSQTLVKTNMALNSTIISGVRDTSHKATIIGLLFYNFYTQWTIGRFLKKIYQKTLKVWLKK